MKKRVDSWKQKTTKNQRQKAYALGQQSQSKWMNPYGNFGSNANAELYQAFERGFYGKPLNGQFFND